MKTRRKVIVTRTALLAALAVTAGLFAFAVSDDRSNGTLMDPEGVIDRDLVTPLDERAASQSAAQK